jgi:DoxX-like protein
MYLATIVLSVLLALAVFGAGGTKLAGTRRMREGAAHAHFPYPAWRGIGALEVAGGAGLLVGLAYAPLGIAAAIGLVLLMIGAVATHLRVGDPVTLALPALAHALVAAAVLVLRIASA